MPGLIPEHVLEQVRHANDVVEVIGAYFPLKRAGANFRALCPFHKEKTPSFNVNPTRQIWHCFGCGLGGDVFKFVMQYENLDFVAAVERLAERGGVRLELEQPGSGPTRDERQLLFRVNERAAEFFHDNLHRAPGAQPARDYLKRRGLSDEVVNRWRLGYAPAGWDGLLAWARGEQLSEGLLETAGLAIRGEKGLYDRFRGRLMFPVADDQGRVVGFSGRILTDAKDQPKYVNSPETAIFHKGRILFAFDKAKRAILDDKFAVVCEGQVDTIACHENGLNNVVAPQGTALTEQHARLLKRYAEEVTLLFDGDTAGQSAAVKNAEPLWEAGLTIRVALLPPGHDPDSFLKQHGVAALRAVLAEAAGFFDFLLARLAQQHDPASDRGKVQISRQMVDWLCRIRDPILQATYTQRTAARLDLREEAIREAMAQQRGRERPAAEEELPAEAVSQPRAEPAEELLLQLMLTDERLIAGLHTTLEQRWLSGGVAGELIRRVLGLHAAGEWTGPNSLLQDQSPTEETSQLASRLLMEPAPQEDRVARATTDCVTALERRWTEREFKRLQARLRTPNVSSSEIVSIQQQILDLRRRLDHIGGLSVWRNAKPAIPE